LWGGQLVEIDPPGSVHAQEVFRNRLEGAKQEDNPIQAVPDFGGDLGL